VTEPEDREPNAAEKEAWLPPRLRDKLGSSGGGDGDDEDFLRRKPANMIPGIIATLVVVLMLGAVFMMIRSGQQKEKAAQAKVAEAAHQQVVADSLARAHEDSLATVARIAMQDSIAAFMKTPAGRRAFAKARADSVARARAEALASQPQATPPPAGGAPAGGSAAPSQPAPPPSSYGIQVGHFLDEGDANAKLTEYKAAAGLDGRVLNDNGTFNVVLGTFASKAAATTRLNALMSKIQADEYIVVTLPK
jgi:sporulation related protein